MSVMDHMRTQRKKRRAVIAREKKKLGQNLGLPKLKGRESLMCLSLYLKLKLKRGSYCVCNFLNF